MSKYSLKLIWNYVNGEEVPNIDELEADYKFMIEVMKVTYDKKIYNLCSKEMKINYEFIKAVINIFSKDKNFITKVATEYLKKISSEDITYKELIFLVCELLNADIYDCTEEMCAFYIKRNCIYQMTRVYIEAVLTKEELFWKKDFGLGFIYITSSKLGNSEIITRYFAEMFLKDIFYQNDELTLEDLIHQHFTNYEELKEIGIKKYILNYVSYKDKYLADYLINNLELIEKLEKNIINIGTNWNNYLARLKDKKDEKFETEAINLIEKYNTSFSYEEICHHIDKMDLNLPIKLKEYVYYDKNIEDYIDYSDDVVDVIDESNISFNDYKCIKDIINLAKDIYFLSAREKKLLFHHFQSLFPRNSIPYLTFSHF